MLTVQLAIYCEGKCNAWIYTECVLGWAYSEQSYEALIESESQTVIVLELTGLATNIINPS